MKPVVWRPQKLKPSAAILVGPKKLLNEIQDGDFNMAPTIRINESEG